MDRHELSRVAAVAHDLWAHGLLPQIERRRKFSEHDGEHLFVSTVYAVDRHVATRILDSATPLWEGCRQRSALCRRILGVGEKSLGVQLREALARTRKLLAYRRPGSLVAAWALQEAWASCVHATSSGARPIESVARC